MQEVFIFIQQGDTLSLMLTSVLVAIFHRDNEKEISGRYCAKNGLSYRYETPSMETPKATIDFKLKPAQPLPQETLSSFFLTYNKPTLKPIAIPRPFALQTCLK